MLEARKVDPNGACPTFFRACCEEAKSGRLGGYANAGWHLGLHTPRQLERCESSRVLSDLDALRAACSANDAAGVFRWYEEHLPRCARLVPKRRRGQFARGVIRAWAERQPF